MSFTSTGVHMGPTTTVSVARYEDRAPIVTIGEGGDWWVNFSPDTASESAAELGDQIAAAFTEYAAEIRRMHAAGIPARPASPDSPADVEVVR